MGPKSGGGQADRSNILQSAHPGALKTDLQRYTPAWQILLFVSNFTAPTDLTAPLTLIPRIQKLIMHDAIYGAYTELYAGLSKDITAAHSGTYGMYIPSLL